MAVMRRRRNTLMSHSAGIDARATEKRRARPVARGRQAWRRRVAFGLALVIGGLGVAVALACVDDSARTASAAIPAAKPAAQSRQRGPLGSGKPVTFGFAGDMHFESSIRERLASSPASVL